MKADPFKVGHVLKESRRFVVPIYQRTYAWSTRPHLEAFFDQIQAKAEERLAKHSIFAHYMGAILVIPRGYAFGQMETVDIVDGQQRLTTFQLFLAAMRDLAREYGLGSTNDLLRSYMINADGPQLRERFERYKLYPTAYDRDLYCDLVDLGWNELRKKYPDRFYKNGKVLESAPLPLRAWGYFRAEAAEFMNAEGEGGREGRLNALSAALLENFQIIVITLDERDDAQAIFETLNAGGEPLAAMDLVRNDVFHRATRAGEDVEVLMERRWKAFEDDFWKERGRRGRIVKPRIDFFLSDMLTAETGRETVLTELYAKYRDFVAERKFPTVDLELETLLKHAPAYRMLVQPTGDGVLVRLARELAAYDVTTAYPLVLVVEDSDATDEDKSAIYRLIVSYVARRMLCGFTAKAYNNVFPRIAVDLKAKGVSFANARDAFAALDGETVRFPSLLDLGDAIVGRRQYGYIQQGRLRHVLCAFELAARSKFDEATTLPDDLTIEHVLPDSWMEAWPLPDGSAAAADLRTGMSESQLNQIAERERLKHTLGNLTLLNRASNPSLGNTSFENKRSRLSRSLLKLNQDIAAQPVWGEPQISARGLMLLNLAEEIWPGLEK